MNAVAASALAILSVFGALFAGIDVPVEDVVSSLEETPVYVEPGAPSTNSDTQGVLLRRIDEGDHLIVVMLAGDDETPSEAEMMSYARQIDDALGGQNIVGLVIGDESVGYSTILPSGQANELMHRANSVATNPSETMSTFIGNVHSWQVRNPEAVILVPTETPVGDSGGFPVVPVVGGSLIIALVAIATAVAARKRSVERALSAGRVRLKESPDEIKRVLGRIQDLAKQVQDPAMNSTLANIRRDTEAFFVRSARQGSARDEDASVLRRHLESVESVLERYIDVQKHPRYYDNPKELMQNGAQALDGFEAYVLSNVRRGSKRVLTSYNVDTKILEAQRYG